MSQVSSPDVEYKAEKGCRTEEPSKPLTLCSGTLFLARLCKKLGLECNSHPGSGCHSSNLYKYIHCQCAELLCVGSRFRDRARDRQHGVGAAVRYGNRNLKHDNGHGEFSSIPRRMQKYLRLSTRAGC